MDTSGVKLLVYRRNQRFWQHCSRTRDLLAAVQDSWLREATLEAAGTHGARRQHFQAGGWLSQVNLRLVRQDRFAGLHSETGHLLRCIMGIGMAAANSRLKN